jgi:hypothetical protein
MLDAGLCTLAHLKSRILPEAARMDTEYDAALGKLGLAIAGRMEGHCARRFARLSGAVDEFSALTLSVCLRRQPLETISSIQIRTFTGVPEDYDGDYQLDPTAGLISFAAIPGHSTERIIVTYTGGYWLDDENGTAMPSGATPLPDDLLDTFVSEVQLHAETRGIFAAVGLRSGSEKDKARLINGLSDDTIEALRPYRRFSGE